LVPHLTLDDARIRRVIVLAAIVVGAYELYLIAWRFRMNTVSLDFSLFYTSSLAMREHGGPYWVDLRPLASRVGVNLGPVMYATYPPTFIWLMEPLTLLPPWAAYWTWTAISSVLLIASLFLLLADEAPAHFAAIFAALAIYYRPTAIEFHFAQTQILLLFLLALMIRALRARRDAAAGLILSFAVLLKAFPLFMAIFFVCDRRWRAMAFLGVGIVAGFAITAIGTGPRAFEFFSALKLTTVPVAGPAMLPIIGVAGTVERMTGYLAGAAAISRFSVLLHLVTALIDLALVTLAVRATLTARARSDELDHSFGLLVATMVLVVPNAWPHYMVLFLIPFLQLATAWLGGRAPWSAILFGVAAYLIAQFSYSWGWHMFFHGRPILAQVLMEGMFISAVLSFISFYQLVTWQPADAAETEHRLSLAH